MADSSKSQKGIIVEGYQIKGGVNPEKSKIKTRPAKPAPMKPTKVEKTSS